MHRGTRQTAGAALFACAVASLACGEPTAGVLAAWINTDIGVEVHQAQIYDAGRRDAVPWVPDLPGSGADKLQIGIDDRGRGVAIAGKRITAYQSLRDGRQVSLVKADYDGGFFFSRNGDAVLRPFEPDVLGRTLALLPTASVGAGQAELRSPVAQWTDSVWSTITAADAPILFWVEQIESPLRADGIVRAVAYPSDLGDALPISAPAVLGTGYIRGHAVVEGGHPTRISNSPWCPGRVCVSPSGRVLSTMMPDQPCVLNLWTWMQDDDAEVLDAVRVPLPEGCREEDNPWLLAQIDDHVFVLDDDERIHVADLRANTMLSAPKLGDGLEEMLVRDRGRVVLLVTYSGQVVRADASGPRLLSTEHAYCSSRDAVVASPTGNWVVQSCSQITADVFTPISRAGAVMRVSALGVESFLGVAMRVLAVDDEGNALLFSHNGGSPRTLFVLSGDGQLARVDTLNPAPQIVHTSTMESGYFVAAPVE